MRYLIYILLLLGSNSFASTPMSQVDNSVQSQFLAEAIDEIKSRDFAPPGESQQIDNAINQLILQAELLKLVGPAMQQLLLQQGNFQNNEALQTILKPLTDKNASDFLASFGQTSKQGGNITPSMFNADTLATEMQRSGLTTKSLDPLFLQLTQQHASDATRQLKSSKEPTNLIAEMLKGSEKSLLPGTLGEVKDLRTMIEKIKQSWPNDEE